MTVSTHRFFLHIMIFFLEILCTMKMKVRITSLGFEVFHFTVVVRAGIIHVVSSFFNSFCCNINASLEISCFLFTIVRDR